VKVAFHVDADLRRIDSANVLGVLSGSDPALARQAVIYTAHHDHLGVGLPKDGDAIYNGAVDNASGVAALLTIARAATLARRPRRTLLFMAVTAEEQGLLGSEWYCEHPTFRSADIAADINIDGLNVDGRTADVGFTGLGKSSLDDVVVSVAAAQGRTVHGDPFPEKGSYYRSDQFSFAKIGVPGIYARGGPSYVGRPAGWGEEREKEFEMLRYHQPSDQYDPTWDLRGPPRGQCPRAPSLDAGRRIRGGEKGGHGAVTPARSPGPSHRREASAMSSRRLASSKGFSTQGLASPSRNSRARSVKAPPVTKIIFLAWSGAIRPSSS
jgi:hypothetical protein